MCFVDRIFSTFPEDTNGLCDIYEVAMQQAEEKVFWSECAIDIIRQNT